MIGCTHSGSRSIGKNVPENSVIGISTSRNSTVNAEPSSCTPGGEGRDRRRHRRAGEQRDQQRRPDPGRPHAPEDRDHRHVDRAAAGDLDRHPGEVSGHDLAGADRGGRHGEVVALPLEAGEHRIRRVEHPRLHRRDAQQGRREPHEVVEAAGGLRRPARAVDEGAEPDAEGEQEQQRLQDRRDGRGAPVAPVPRPVVLDDEQHAAERAGGTAGRRTRKRKIRVASSQSTRLRPVSRRNTSSSDERRTSADSGRTPRRASSACRCSPSGV